MCWFDIYISFLGCLHVRNKYAHLRSSFIDWKLPDKPLAQWPLADLWKSCGKIKSQRHLIDYYTRHSCFNACLLFVFALLFFHYSLEQEWEERYIHENHSKVLKDGFIEMVSFQTRRMIRGVMPIQTDGAHAPSDWWAKWILNSASKRQNISHNHTSVIRSFSASYHQLINSNLCSLAGAEPETL